MLNIKLDCAGGNGHEAAGQGELGAGLQDTTLWGRKITLWKRDHFCFIWILQIRQFLEEAVAAAIAQEALAHRGRTHGVFVLEELCSG